jgi:hypothetical protein
MGVCVPWHFLDGPLLYPGSSLAGWPTTPTLIEQIAAVGDYLVALETYRAAVKRWPKNKITLRNRARVIEKTWED